MEWTGLIVNLVLFLVCLFLVYKLSFLFVVLTDYISFLNIAFRGASTSTSHLHLYVCPLETIDLAAFEELNRFFEQLAESSFHVESVRKLVNAAYSHAVLVRRRTDGSLQGYLYYGKERGVLNGRKYTLFTIGPMVFNHSYRRNILPLLVLVYHTLYELIFHPTRSVYFAGKGTTYKSYLSGLSKTQHFYPRYDRKTPKFEADLLNKFAESVCSPGETYNREKFVLEREKVQFKPSSSFITEEDMKNPHIRFYVEQNPGWVKGHSMFGIGQVTWWQVILLAYRSVSITRSSGTSGVARGSKRNIESKLQKIHDRHLTYQSDIGKREVTEQYRMTTELLHKHRSSRTQLDSVSEIDEFDDIL